MEVWTIQKILNWTEGFFKDRQIDTPRLDAEILLAHVIKMERFYLYVNFDQVLKPEQLAQYRELITKRVQRVPVAYLVGSKAFMSLNFKVNRDVLIPRPDTETLVNYATEKLRKMSGELKVADIGTGSGAIGISILRFVKNSIVSAVDISEKAIEIATTNADLNKVTDRIKFYTGDLLKPLTGQKFKAVLSNPPYIPNKVVKTLQPEVAQYEPKLALEGGEDGLDFYRRLVKDAPDFIEEGGFLAVEIGINQAAAVKNLIESDGRLKDIESRKDLAGIERVIAAWKK